MNHLVNSFGFRPKSVTKLFVLFTAAAGLSSAEASLIYNFDFEEGSTANIVDSVNNVTLTRTGDPTLVAGGIDGQAALFSPTVGNAYDRYSLFDVNGILSDLTGGKSGLTLSAWINIAAYAPNTDATANNQWVTLFAINRGGVTSSQSASARANISIGESGQIRVGGRKLDGDDFRSATGTGSLALNTWVHVAAVFDYTAVNAQNGSIQVYVNGEPITTTALSGAWGTGTNSSNTLASGFSIGSNRTLSDTNTSEQFNGMIDLVQVYDAPLDAQGVQGLYLTQVPEPSALTLAGIATVGLMAFRRRRSA